MTADKGRKIMVATMDGFGPDYLQASDMPNLKHMIRDGFYKTDLGGLWPESLQPFDDYRGHIQRSVCPDNPGLCSFGEGEGFHRGSQVGRSKRCEHNVQIYFVQCLVPDHRSGDI